MSETKKRLVILANKPSVGAAGDEFGKWIDAHDVVVRLNDVKFGGGYGHKISTHVIGSSLCKTRIHGCRTIDYTKQGLVSAMDKETNGALYQRLKGCVASTGLLALTKCIRELANTHSIDVVGFDSSWGEKEYQGLPEQIDFHRCSDGVIRPVSGVNKNHCWELEEELIKMWHQNGVVNMIQQEDIQNILTNNQERI